MAAHVIHAIVGRWLVNHVTIPVQLIKVSVHGSRSVSHR
jgi:hypothetical protein